MAVFTAEVLVRFSLDDSLVMKLREVARQAYTNVEFSAGIVDGNDEEDVYWTVELEGEEPLTHHFERHEALAVVWVLSQALWVSELEQGEGDCECET